MPNFKKVTPRSSSIDSHLQDSGITNEVTAEDPAHVGRRGSRSEIRAEGGKAQRADIIELPPTPSFNKLPRTELLPMYTALDALWEGQDHILLFTITGTFGSGKSYALDHIASLAQAKGIIAVHINLEKTVRAHRGSIPLQVQHVLEIIAEEIKLDLGDLHSVQPGIATLRESAKRLREVLDNNIGLKVLLTFDDSDTSPEAYSLIERIEDVLFNQLMKSGTRSFPTLVAVSSRHEIKWEIAAEHNTHIALQPFTLAQTQEQLECSVRQAEHIMGATAGLPAANARLKALGIEDRSVEENFQRVYREFVAPLLGSDPVLSGAIRAAALLDRGFGVTEFMEVVRSLSYLKGLYTEEGKAFYFNEIDKMFGLGLISFDNERGRYFMETHIAALLDLWNRYELRAEYAGAKRKAEEAYALVDAATISLEVDDTPLVLPNREPKKSAALLPSSDLNGVYQFIARKARSTTSGQFVGRRHAIEDIAAYLCRRPGYEADIVFLQGSAGSGKTALLGHFATLAQEAAGKYTGLLVPVQASTDRSSSPRQQVADDDPDYDDPNPGILDLEFSDRNRLGTVRRAIKKALVDTIVAREKSQWKHDPFAEYDQVYGQWEKLQATIRRQEGPEARRRLAREEERKIRYIQERLTVTFYEACRSIARRRDGSTERQRILLVFDTYDYPIRSGLSATQFISEIAAQLAGDYFFLIACRPPIEVELKNPLIGEKLDNYLPDDLRDQAAIVDLDSKEYRLEESDIIAYYRNRPWYKTKGREALANKMAQIIFEHDSLPVLLSLIENYVGVNDPRQVEEFAQNPDKLDLLLKNDDAFMRDLVDDLIRPAAPDQPSSAQQWALLLMSVLDRGISKRLLDDIYGSLRAIFPNPPSGAIPQDAEMSTHTIRIPTATEIWDAVRDIAGQNIGIKKSPMATLVKRVQSTRRKNAYKLHDYVSTLFNRYSEWKLDDMHKVGTALIYSDVLRILKERERVTKAVWLYMYKIAEEYRPDLIARREDEVPEDALHIYQTARANQVYYGIRLAAIQLEDESKGRRSIGKIVPGDCAYLNASEMIAELKSDKLKNCIGIESSQMLPASETARLVFGYLFGKVARQVWEYMDYGFSEMLLQEVRYYLYDQGTQNKRIANLTLPIVESIHTQDAPLWQASRLYYAALLMWEVASDQYPIPDPWLDEQPKDGSLLRAWRQSEVWQAITELSLPKAEITDGRVYQRKYADRLDTLKYAARAHDAYSLLLIDSPDPRERTELLRLKAAEAMDNPTEVYYRSDKGILKRETKGFQAAERYLQEAHREAQEITGPGEGSVLWHARIHRSFGYLYGLLDYTYWEIQPARKVRRESLPDWGALRHSYEGLRLLRERPKQHGHADYKAEIDYARTLNNHAYNLALVGEVKAARAASDRAIQLLSTLVDILAPIYKVGEDGRFWAKDETSLLSAASKAVSQAYLTWGDIWRMSHPEIPLCRREELDDNSFTEVIECYTKAREQYESVNESVDREWNAKLEAEQLFINFAYEVHKRLHPSKTYQHKSQTLLEQVREMQQLMYKLWPTDRPSGYRRLASMYTCLASLGMAIDVQPDIDYLDPETIKLINKLNRKTPRSQSALHAFISLGKGYRFACEIDDMHNRLLLTSDAVELLAEYEDAEVATKFYKKRLRHLKLTSKITGYTQGVMAGLSTLAIGFAYLRLIREKGGSAHIKRAQLQEALSSLLTGFNELNVLSKEDYFRLEENIAKVEANLDLFDTESLMQLYGALKQHKFGDRWNHLLEKISTHLIQQPPLDKVTHLSQNGLDQP
jgi:hypothetical protein